jgi:hypothetical protein
MYPTLEEVLKQIKNLCNSNRPTQEILDDLREIELEVFDRIDLLEND